MTHARILNNDRGHAGGIGSASELPDGSVSVSLPHVGDVVYPREHVEPMRFDRSIGEFIPEQEG